MHPILRCYLNQFCTEIIIFLYTPTSHFTIYVINNLELKSARCEIGN